MVGMVVFFQPVMLNGVHCCPVKDLSKTFTGQPVEK